MRHIVLISCVKRKAESRTKCCDLYQSDLFRKSLAYARSLVPEAIFVLSAKYGLVDLEREIEPYDVTLNAMSRKDAKMWAGRVLEQLGQVAELKEDCFTFLAAEKYRRYLLPHLSHSQIPMEGLRIGQQLRFLMERTS